MIGFLCSDKRRNPSIPRRMLTCLGTQILQRHWAFLDTNAAIKARYWSDPAPLDHFGLPMSYRDMGNSFVVRAQRAVFQYWKEDVPWAKKGEVTLANSGDLAKEAGVFPSEAITPLRPSATPAPRASATSGPISQ